MVVFKANLASGGSAIIRATISDSLGTGNDAFTVYKDFSDNSSANVSISLSCSSGSVTNNPQWASEVSPAVFNISGAGAGATCTAVENSVPAGYTANQADCQNGDPLNGSCTIVNNVIPTSSNSFTVYKDFSDNNSGSVNVSLSCTSGTVTNNPRLAREGASIVLNYGTHRNSDDHYAGSDSRKRAEDVAKHVRKLGGEAIVVKADTRSEEDTIRMVSESMKAIGSIDILVCAAGGSWTPQDIEKVTYEHWRDVIEAEIDAQAGAADLVARTDDAFARADAGSRDTPLAIAAAHVDAGALDAEPART